MADEYGVLNTGFVVKRLNEILVTNRAMAVTLFQDQVNMGDVVDTSDSSILGRLIGIVAPAEADLWEAGQEIYDAFNPDSATGIALDNLVAISGLTREAPSYATAQAIFSGDVSTLISAGQSIKATTSNNNFTNSQSIVLNPGSATGIGLKVNTVANNTTYSFTYSNSNTSTTVTYTSGTNATTATILAGLAASVANSFSLLDANVVSNILYVSFKDKVSSYSWSSSSNLGIVKSQNIASIRATTFGPILQEPNTITQIQTPVLGWDTITNPARSTGGSFTETDEELRERFRQSKYLRATNILEAMYSALISLDNVQEVQIYENVTDVTDSSGILPHSFMSVVLGGSDQDVANTIWKIKPLGIRADGNTKVTVYDSQGFGHIVGFQRPTPVDIAININITTDSNYPSDGDAQIRSALISYFQQNYGIGDSVIPSRLYSPINSVPGHQVNSLLVGRKGQTLGTGRVSIPFTGIASLSSANITITKT